MQAAKTFSAIEILFGILTTALLWCMKLVTFHVGKHLLKKKIKIKLEMKERTETIQPGIFWPHLLEM